MLHIFFEVWDFRHVVSVVSSSAFYSALLLEFPVNDAVHTGPEGFAESDAYRD